MPITDANVPQMLPQGSVTEGLFFVGSTNHPDPRMVCMEPFILLPPSRAQVNDLEKHVIIKHLQKAEGALTQAFSLQRKCSRTLLVLTTFASFLKTV